MSTSGTTEGSRQGRGEQNTGVPRWVKVFAASVVALILIGVAVMLLSGGQHGPGRHTSSSAQSPTASAGVGAGNGRAGRSVLVVTW